MAMVVVCFSPGECVVYEVICGLEISGDFHLSPFPPGFSICIALS